MRPQDEQRLLEQAWQREGREEGAATSGSGGDGSGGDGGSSSSTDGGRPRSSGLLGGRRGGGVEHGAGASGSGSGSDDDEDEWEEDDSPYTDKRWRRVHLLAHGGRWPPRLARLRELARAGALRRVRLADGTALDPRRCAPTTGHLR
jgi:hypothetical protein